MRARKRRQNSLINRESLWRWKRQKRYSFLRVALRLLILNVLMRRRRKESGGGGREGLGVRESSRTRSSKGRRVKGDMSWGVDCAWKVRMGKIALVALDDCGKGMTDLVKRRDWGRGEVVGRGERRWRRGGVKIEELVERCVSCAPLK